MCNSNTDALIIIVVAAVFIITLAWFIFGSKKSPGDKNRCSTRKKIEKFNFTWTIYNFSYYDEEVLQSGTFSADWPNGKDQWYLRLYPNGES